MKKQEVYAIIFFVFSLILVGCSSQEDKLNLSSEIDIPLETQESQENLVQEKAWTDVYAFPLDEDIVSNELAQMSQKWNLESAKSFQNNHNNFHLKNEIGITLSIDTRGDENKRGISASFFYPSDTDETKLFNGNEIEELLSFLLNLYCDTNKEEAVIQFRKFQAEDEFDKTIRAWLYRQNGTHYFVELSYPNDLKVLQPRRIHILDTIAYEKMISSLGKSFEKNASSKGLESVEALTVEQLKKYKESKEDNPETVKVKGILTDLKEEGSSIKLPPALRLRTDVTTCKTAFLSDDTGKIPVVIMPTTFNKQELSNDRIHYIVKYKEAVVIFVSVKE